jgi:hypothetical protein
MNSLDRSFLGKYNINGAWYLFYFFFKIRYLHANLSKYSMYIQLLSLFSYSNTNPNVFSLFPCVCVWERERWLVFSCLPPAQPLICLASCGPYVHRSVVDPGPCRQEGSVLLFFLSLIRVCVLLRKTWRRWLPEDGIKSSRLAFVLETHLASAETVWRFVSVESCWIWFVFLMIYASLYRRWRLLSCIGHLVH